MSETPILEENVTPPEEVETPDQPYEVEVESDDPFDMVYAYNESRGLLEAGYSDKRESAFSIEEMLEGFDLSKLHTTVAASGVKVVDGSAKHLSRSIIELISGGNEPEIENVDRLDKHLDSIVYNLGAIYKLGLNPIQAKQALAIVMKRNLLKSYQVDEAGKNIKGADWTPPEEELAQFFN